MLNRVSWLGASSDAEIKRHRATVSYWLSRFDVLTDMAAAGSLNDTQLLFVAANASFRGAAPQTGDRKAAVERLDGVLQSYAEVLRHDPSFSDAAYNYEFVSRLRDTLAKAPGRASDRDKKTGPSTPESVSVDLPTGATIHGRPGGPPVGSNTGTIKTISPMRYDEREQQIDPGRGSEIKRKG